MGRDKTLLPFGRKKLGELAVEKLAVVCRDVYVVGNSKNLGGLGLPVVPDAIAECGPLGGIVAGLEQSSLEWNLFLAVDMPFVPVNALRSLLFCVYGLAPGMAAIALVNGQPQPICGVYSKRALPTLRRELEAGRFRVLDAIKAAGAVSFVPMRDASWFRNLNTPEDFAEAEKDANILDTQVG
jgi:molybdopterin-guanine dinucleotide biosynthesis protein A